MLFNPAPKEKREDLYDFDEPFRKLSTLLQEPVERSPLIVVKGMRRTGKTSLIKTALNKLGASIPLHRR
jgi:predicted AAA+ superfamily ATPase